ncbi:HAMP domain-containing sensor histidine kinase [Niallia sp. NCCP-28]|uniref:sensor histidine kinase n=1 Tax=Niallia sp. NCCP-28 TaxID=2934712 RepID=UPI002084666C|nr:HAMP domain-containing sensor histidine kinase [Niallia sp. NCCP-28]GKU84384.1 two-component sensor histidine kinase [Niallia sp. NCCP-28]
MFETLLLNFLFLLFPVMIYLIFFEHKSYASNRWIFILLSSLTMVLCITIPIKMNIGFIFDLRYIPFIMVALYGGYKNIFILYIILNIYRFYIGGEGTLNSFIFSTAAFLLIPMLRNKFLRFDSKKRVITASAISFILMGIYLSLLSTYFQELTKEFWLLVVHALTTHVIMIAIITLLIERIIANSKNREKYLHSERLNVVSELSASVSHEIRNPLTVTSGFLQLLNTSHTITQEEKKYVELSLQELKRAEKIVSDYLSLAKPQSENMIYSNLYKEVEYTTNLLLPYARMHQVEIQLSFTNTLSTRYDHNQIQQCLINLIKNGIESMKETDGGTLTINVLEQSEKILLVIQDTGIGMTKEEISRLGKPYYSTKEEGTGLGMLMVYNTVDKIKGSLKVESEKGKGTTFYITIPV